MDPERVSSPERRETGEEGGDAGNVAGSDAGLGAGHDAGYAEVESGRDPGWGKESLDTDGLDTDVLDEYGLDEYGSDEYEWADPESGATENGAAENGEAENGEAGSEQRRWWSLGRRSPKELGWRVTLSVTVLAAIVGLGGGIWAERNVASSYMITGTGPVGVAGEYVTVEEGWGTEEGILYLTVASQPASLAGVFAAFLDPRRVVVPRPPSSEYANYEEMERWARLMMEESQRSAVVAAFEYYGEELVYEGEGAEITVVLEGSAADVAGLAVGEVIVAVDDEEVALGTDLVRLVTEREVGEGLEIRVKDDEGREREVNVVLGEFWVDGNPQMVDEERPMLGVTVVSSELHFVTARDVEFTLRGVGGPSAGLAWGLEILEQLREEKLGDGVVAATGVLEPDGTVHSIGGVRQKVWGAVAAGARLMIVPAANAADAIDEADGAIEVVGVRNLAEAVEAIGARSERD